MIGRLLCRIGWHKWTPPRGDGYQRSVCERPACRVRYSDWARR